MHLNVFLSVQQAVIKLFLDENDAPTVYVVAYFIPAVCVLAPNLFSMGKKYL